MIIVFALVLFALLSLLGARYGVDSRSNFDARGRAESALGFGRNIGPR